MKKKFAIGLIALLSVSFIFFGCGDSGGGGSSSQQTDLEKAVDELVEALGEAGLSVDVTDALGGIITLAGDDEEISVDTPITIGAGLTLVVPNEKTFIVEADVTVDGGTIQVAAGGSLVGPALDETGEPVDTTIIFENGGKVAVAQGATLFAGDTKFVDSDPEDTEALYKWSSGTNGVITLKADNVTELTSGKLEIQKETGIAATSSVVIASGAELTVSANYQVWGTLEVATGGTLVGPALNETGVPEDEAIIFQGTGKVEIAQGATLFAGTTEFVSTGADALYKWTGASGGKITLKGGNITELTSGELEIQNDTGIAVGSSVVIAEGTKLTVSAGKTYLVWGAIDNSGTIEGASGAKIIFVSGASMSWDSEINFYDTGSTVLNGSSYTASANTTFAWDTNAGGEGTAGWKAEAAE
jgi:phage gp45-like